MKSSTAVQPIHGRSSAGNLNQASDHLVAQLINGGGDAAAAEQLVNRLTKGRPPADKFEGAADRSFVDLIVTLSNSGGRLTSVS